MYCFFCTNENPCLRDFTNSCERVRNLNRSCISCMWQTLHSRSAMHHPLTHLKILVQNWVYKTSWLYQFNNLYFGSLYFVFSKCIFLCWPRPSSDWWWTRYTSRRWLPLDRWCLLYRKILNLTSAIKYDSVFWEGCSQLCFYLVLQNCLDFLSQIKSQL